MFLFPNVNFMVGPSCLPPTSSLSWLIYLVLISARPYILFLLGNIGDKGQGGVLLMEPKFLIARLNSYPIEHTWNLRTFQI